MRISYLLLVLTLLVSGCAAGATGTPAPPGLPVSAARTPPGIPTATVSSLPPPTSSPTPSDAGEPVRPSTTPACQNSLKFVADLTVPDGTIVARGAVIDKRWQVENNGTCNWDEGYRFKLISGPDLGSPSEQALFPARSGAVAVIRALFVAPSMPGVYRSAWQAVGPDAETFGDIIYIEVRVN